MWAPQSEKGPSVAQKYVTVKTSDLSGVDLADGEGETLTFAIGRSSYVMDLTDDEVGGFYDALKPYTDVARRSDTRQAPANLKASGSKRDLSPIRVWANANGFAVSTRGRVPANVLAAYDAAK